MKPKQEPWMKQAKAQAAYENVSHTEDCLDANDDTSVLKGKCICTKTQHTPLPWSIEGEFIIAKEPTRSELKKLGLPVHRQVAKTYVIADAAFIVRAVNAHEAHEELRELLKKVLTRSHIIDALLDTELMAFQQAIAKAEGK